MVWADAGRRATLHGPGALMDRALVVLLAAVAGLAVGSACGSAGSQDAVTSGTEPSSVPEGARRIPVVARSFSFAPEKINARVGEGIAIELTSEDGLHDLTIDALGAHVAVEKGETAVGGFRLDQPGRYTFYCSVRGHLEAGMEGVLVAES